MNDPTMVSQRSKPADPNFVRSQVEQSLELWRSQLSLATQIMTVLAVGDVTLIGYAFSAHSSSVLLAGAVFPLLALYLLYRFNKMMVPVIYTAVSLERKYGGRDTDWLANTFISTAVSMEAIDTLIKISAEPAFPERVRKLRQAKVRPMGSGKGLVRATLAVAAIVQIIASIVLSLFFQWQLF